MGSHSVHCHPLPQPITGKAGTLVSNPRGMQGWVGLVDMVTYQCGIPARRWSPIPVLTWLNVEQLRSRNKRCYRYSQGTNLGGDSDSTSRFSIMCSDSGSVKRLAQSSMNTACTFPISIFTSSGKLSCKPKEIFLLKHSIMSFFKMSCFQV